MFDPRRLLESLVRAEAEVVVVGGMAAVVAGASYVTGDLDLCYAPDPANRQRLADALAPLEPYPRGVDPGLPFTWDARTLRDTPFLTLVTEAGDLDLMPDVPGVGGYEAVAAASRTLGVFGLPIRVLSLDALIDAKRAMGRPKDLALLTDLEALRALRGGG